MMCQFNPKNNSRFIDPCMVGLIDYLNGEGIRTVSCCCGHGKYPMTIVVRTRFDGLTQEVCSGTMFIGRKKRYYRKDKDGVYYIPEIEAIN